MSDALDVAPAASESPTPWQHECGVMAVSGHDEAAALTRFGLFALQHRGEESAGIATLKHGNVRRHRGMGLVGDAINDDDLARLAKAPTAIGHVRYSTTGASEIANAQPLVFTVQGREIALAHNGNLTNAHTIRERLESEGAIFQTTSDTEVIAHIIARMSGSLPDRVRKAVRAIRGAYALLVMGDDCVVAARDPHGLRPMVLGSLDTATCIASESCAFNAISATRIRDIAPGEMVVLRGGKLESSITRSEATTAHCTFEHIYFARPDSDIDGHGVHDIRSRMGGILADEHPADADVVIGVPDSSLAAAMGYARSINLPYDIGLIKSHYIGRTFIQPSQAQRERGVRLKLSPVRSVIEGKRVIMVDDSLVRGTTARRIVQLLREAGAAELHVRIASPPVSHSCYYGIDTSHRSELLAARLDTQGIAAHIGADSLAFLSEDEMMRAFDVESGDDHSFCNACFTGNYPVAIDDAIDDPIGTRSDRSADTQPSPAGVQRPATPMSSPDEFTPTTTTNTSALEATPT